VSIKVSRLARFLKIMAPATSICKIYKAIMKNTGSKMVDYEETVL
jgi:hypothetical protein